MPTLEQKGQYPLIDIDPHFSRVVRFFRVSDYAAWAALSAGTPALYYAWEQINPTNAIKSTKVKLAVPTTLGVLGGFLLAYQRSSFRFFGWTENQEEQEKDMLELSQRAKDGKAIYGDTQLTPYLQGVAHRNSAFSQLKLATIPWFNFANHSHHGVDTQKYSEQQ
ncbi:hypothetical protein E3Q22_00972 [Wallemia mellicola]|uniref:NADH-ubiquinone oxidoreductase 21 kDa subunit n=2 Tax=Wallemia mellicola TaxID=1708541 RepID=A0A4T0NUK4_9BASI|nr:hypothetical protein WALSEDRAFT_59280 [Wallemia mellicola CBS 633.66]TIB78732.1 hypothetical protein E3Q23_00661 [Wallemia mellicola]EIM23598.1 hypothetical protein WALSEDRAFT_59280 [Wallemia mellicola CBS 633.66]TIB81455.1 hypothetical protein E3Q22_00972 [Wallemia mellicola]TIB92109.1 hypothetical protein E3Q20_00399 [Wallemia mellicola]TIB93841.1 hypothetical protein E3Q19_00742 [Wallemia mellicola]|eukprot:XP_006956269.1 hypothetical protein WALSEDRAFT_59280 [Wallemia mellicola CBS 633.66]